MINRMIYDYIYKNKYFTFIYMGYKNKMRKIKAAQIKKNLQIIQEQKEKEKLLNDWVIINNNIVKPVSRVAL